MAIEPKMMGLCKLCLEKKSLIESHLIPSGVDRLSRGEKGERIVISSRAVMYSARDVRAYLLCQECDNSLNKNGETWVIPKLAKQDASFPLLDILEKLPPDTQGDAVLYGTHKNPGLDIGKLTHFTLGIFWKASVHSWKKDRIEPMIELGAYGERLRTFLRAEKPFPEHIALKVRVAPRKDVLNFSGHTQPYRGRCKEAHSYSFFVPGVQFILYAGKQIPRDIRTLCVQSSPLHPIQVCDLSSHLLKIASRMGTTAYISKRLRKGK